MQPTHGDAVAMLSRITGAIGALILAAFLLQPPALAEGIATKGHAASAATSDGVAFRTGCWLGVKADTQATSIAGFSANDTLVGAGAGCDYIVPNTSFLVGIMGDVSKPYGTLGDNGVDVTYFLGGRGGFLLSDRFLAYVLVGETWNGFPSSFPTDATGFTVGAGVELMLTKYLSAGAEWRRVDTAVSGGGGLDVFQDSFGIFGRVRF